MPIDAGCDLKLRTSRDGPAEMELLVIDTLRRAAYSSFAANPS